MIRDQWTRAQIKSAFTTHRGTLYRVPSISPIIVLVQAEKFGRH